MSTTIEWTQRPGTKGETWNPVVGCTKVSQGCKNCYAETVHDRRHKGFLAGKLQNYPQYAQPFRKVQLLPERLTQPLKWKSPRTVFVNSMSDLFHEAVPFEYIDQVFAAMALTPQHTYMILTKRPERMAEYTTQKFGRIADRIIAMRRERGDNGVLIPLPNIRPGAPWWPLANVWLGTSVEDQATVDARIPHLLRCPAAVRFLSCEPLLGAVDLWPVMEVHKEYRRIHENACFRDPSTPPRNIHWVITGGESGHGARPMHPDWARSLRDQCKAAEVPFFFKQWGEWAPHTHVGGVLQSKGNVDLVMSAMTRCGKKTAGNLLDGMTHQEWPVVAQYEVA